MAWYHLLDGREDIVFQATSDTRAWDHVFAYCVEKLDNGAFLVSNGRVITAQRKHQTVSAQAKHIYWDGDFLFVELIGADGMRFSPSMVANAKGSYKRKWEDFGMPSTAKGRERKLHNGEVPTYNVRCETLDILKTAGYIRHGYRINDENERAAIKLQICEMATSAWNIVREYGDPFAHGDFGGEKLPIWLEVLSLLQSAKGKQGKLAETCYLITESGREVTAQFKKLIGATEDDG